MYFINIKLILSIYYKLLIAKSIKSDIASLEVENVVQISFVFSLVNSTTTVPFTASAFNI
jgi:hypothetical protein